MIDFYNESRGCAFHPGGWKLTREAVGKCGFIKGDRLCDMGCGSGDTVERLCDMGYDAVGVEPSEAMGDSVNITRAAAENTGLETESFEGVLFECVLSLCDVSAALSEAARITKKGGRLIVSDLYSEKGGLCGSGAVRRVFSKEEILSEIKAAGYSVTLFEDRTHDMTTFALQLIMDGRGEELCSVFSYLKSIKAGYFLLIAEKV